MDFLNFKNDLSKLIAIRSVAENAQGQFPFGRECALALETFLDIANSFGFQTKNYDYYAGEVTFGQGEEFSILAHLDIVPEGSLSDWQTNPYKLEEKGGKLIGRGVLDDKGPALLVLYALKSLKDEGFIPSKKIRLILGCNEESGWGCINHLKKIGQMPRGDGFSPDADFPVIYAEKGIIHAQFHYDCDPSLSLNGGNAFNMVCDKVEFTLPDADFCQYKEISFENGKYVCHGKTAHGSAPQKGINAMAKLFPILVQKGVIPKSVLKLFSTKTKLLRLSDESGKLTMSPNVVSAQNGKLLVVCDIRYPATIEYERVLELMAKYSDFNVLGHQKSLYHDKNGKLVKTLLGVYNDVTQENATPIAIGGGTYARAMENAVAFGPVFCEQDSVCHQPNEYFKTKQIEKAFEIYKKAIRLCGGKN